MGRHEDGSAGDADYGTIGTGYARYRQPEPMIAAMILAALGEARTVLNVGAGAGSYEPTDRDVTAVEPSASMRAQRPANLPVAVDAVAGQLPFADAAFDASMATFTVHQWPDLRAGLAEMPRVTRGPVVILTCDPVLLDRFWLNDYEPEVIAMEAGRFPSMASIADALGGRSEVRPVPIPLDCTDGFGEAYYGRPERFLDSGVRLAMSAWSFVDHATVEAGLDRLRADLASGAWDATNGHLRIQPEFADGALRLLVSQP